MKAKIVQNELVYAGPICRVRKVGVEMAASQSPNRREGG